MFNEPNKIIGTPENDILFSQGRQIQSESCAVNAQCFILNMFGIKVDEKQLIREGIENGLYSPKTGTDIDKVGNLLVRHGIEVNRYENATMGHLIAELAQGHKVIVGVDDSELLASSPMERLQEKVQDIYFEQPNHALVVTAIELDRDDPMVIVTDPATGEPLHKYPVSQFCDAWKDGNYFMVATKEAPDTNFEKNVNINQSRDLEGDFVMESNNTNPHLGIGETDGSGMATLGSLGHLGSIGETDEGGMATLGSLGHLGGIGETDDVGMATLGSLGHLGGIGETDDAGMATLGSLGHLGGIGETDDVGIATLGSLGHLGSIGETDDVGIATLGSLGHLGGIGGTDEDGIATLGSLGHLGSIGETDDVGMATLGSLGHLGGIGDTENEEIASLGSLGHLGGIDEQYSDNNFESRDPEDTLHFSDFDV